VAPRADLVTVTRADVYKAGALAARLSRSDDRTEFAYLPEYLVAAGRPVATTLPLRPGVRSSPAGALPPFFAGLLPEGRRLTALRRAVKTSADDELSLLLAVGHDLIGDVQVVPAGETPGEPDSLVTVEDWSTVDFDEIVEHRWERTSTRSACPAYRTRSPRR
jgi:serine/threonine-protein kinase HipA